LEKETNAMDNERNSERVERVRVGRDDLLSLLRLRWVQAALVAAAAMPLVSTLASPGGEGEMEGAEVTVAASAEESSSYLSEAWLARATEREAERLVAKYRGQGFRISDELKHDIVEAAERHDIELDVAFGLVRAESSFRNAATSPVGATGLTQLMPRTAAWIAPGTTRADLRDPRTNLDVGFRYLRYLTDKYEGNKDLALLAYNRGQGTVDRALRRGLDPDNGYAAFVRGKEDHGHTLFTRDRR
jgi:soluble lytic murein transglycosylase-like protein